MNEIYKKAIEEQGNQGQPIFLANFMVSKSRFYGNSPVPRKYFFRANKIVCKGKIEDIQKDPKILFACLVKELGEKKRASEADKSKFKIEEVNIVSFHGYSMEK